MAIQKFLIIDDSTSFCTFFEKKLLQKWPDSSIEIYDPCKEGKPDDNYPWKNYDVIFLDYDLGFKNENGLDWLDVIIKNDPAAGVIMLTGEGDETIAVQAIKLGAESYIVKYDLASDLLYEEVMEVIALRAMTEGLNQINKINVDESKSDMDVPELFDVTSSAQNKYVNKWDIPGYFCIREIAKGTWSTTLLAEWIKNQRQVIVKILNIHDVTEPILMKRFVQEFTVLSNLKHPNVVETLDHGFTEDYAYYAMEYLTSGDLASRLKSGNLSIDVAVSYTVSIAKGLSALHELNIVHRDIKPNNVLFKEDGELVIADLGIAKDLSCAEIMTAKGEILGTPFYMSPEQINGKPIDVRSDIYSLGILFYELLMGEKPFIGSSIIAVACQHAYDEPPPLTVELSKYQPIMGKLLAKNPDDRYQSMQEFIDALGEI